MPREAARENPRGDTPLAQRMNERIEQLDVGDAIDSFFVVAALREGTTRNGSTYLTLTLRDATGSRTARVWSPNEACPQGLDGVPGIFRVRGKVEAYREELQFNLDALEPYTPREHEFDALLPTSRWAGSVLVDEIRAHIESVVRSSALKRLLFATLEEPDVAERLASHPAAKLNHHAYRGGLAEHTLSGMRLATLIAGHYAAYYPGRVDGDLLVAGFLLHDIGKVWELEGELAPDYSTFGRLVGHIPAAAAFIKQVADKIGDIPDELVWELQHIILSHHGQLEYGSPKRPKTLEAQLLHFIDNIDATTNTFVSVLESPGWSPFQRNYGRPLLEPSEMRARWTTPPPGEVGERGPGAPSGRAPSRARGPRTPEPADEDAEPVGAAPVEEAEPASARAAESTEPEPAPDEGVSAAPEPTPDEGVSVAPEPAACPEPLPSEAFEDSGFALAPSPPDSADPVEPAPPPKKKEAPSTSRCERTLSLFDGLD